MTDQENAPAADAEAGQTSGQQAMYRVAEVLDHGEGGDGAYVGVRLNDGENRKLVLLVPHEKVATLVARMRAGASFAAIKRSGADPETAGPIPLSLNATSGQVTQRRNGQILFQFDLEDGLKIEVPLRDAALRPLAEAFAKAADAVENAVDGRAGSAGDKSGGTGTA